MSATTSVIEKWGAAIYGAPLLLPEKRQGGRPLRGTALLRRNSECGVRQHPCKAGTFQ
ncbi:hypothetical protein HYS49_01685 [Candidatus Woesearchaeota archaeon]|nr:hypothetical protein [Candidatus Woesearchaeota archaeon]